MLASQEETRAQNECSRSKNVDMNVLQLERGLEMNTRE